MACRLSEHPLSHVRVVWPRLLYMETKYASASCTATHKYGCLLDIRRIHLKIAHGILPDVVLNRGTLVGESTICKSRVKGRCVLLRCPAGHQTVAPPVDPFGVCAVLRTLLGVGAQLLNAVVPDAGDDVGVLHYTRPSVGVSPACRTLM